MEKAYDIKVLLAKLKARGLDMAEEGAIIFIEESFDWLDESFTVSPTKYDDMLKPFIPIIKSKALSSADKIDGKVG